MKESSGEVIGGAALALLMFVIGTPAMTMARALAMSTVWGWYVVEAFDVPRMAPVTAFGVSCLLGLLMFNSSRTKTEDDEDRRIWTVVAKMAAMYVAHGVVIALAVSMAWIGTLFM